jgi:hypothetical protein
VLVVPEIQAVVNYPETMVQILFFLLQLLLAVEAVVVTAMLVVMVVLVVEAVVVKIIRVVLALQRLVELELPDKEITAV